MGPRACKLGKRSLLPFAQLERQGFRVSVRGHGDTNGETLLFCEDRRSSSRWPAPSRPLLIYSAEGPSEVCTAPCFKKNKLITSDLDTAALFQDARALRGVMHPRSKRGAALSPPVHVTAVPQAVPRESWAQRPKVAA